MKLYDTIKEGWIVDSQAGDDSCQSYLSEWVNGVVWCEIECRDSARPTHSRHLFDVNGIGVWYDYGADYFFFEDLDQ